MKTIAPEDLEHILLTDSVDECLSFVRDRAMHQFGLTYGPKATPHPLIGETG